MKTEFSKISLSLIAAVTLVTTYFAYSCSPFFGEESSPAPVSQGLSQLKTHSATKAFCYGSELNVCSFPGQHELDQAADLILRHVETHNAQIPAKMPTHESPTVACAEVAYPGQEPEIIAESHKRGTFICLFNSRYAMNMALGRISAFVEDFVTVDREAGYSHEQWSKAQMANTTLGHNLEAPGIRRYLTETRPLIEARTLSKDPGTMLESEFLHTYIVPKLDPIYGKPESIFLGVYLPTKKPSTDANEKLKSVLGHEIFHGLFFHSKKMRKIVQDYIDELSTDEKKMIEKYLSLRGYAVAAQKGGDPTPQQLYLLANETQAYLLEASACSPNFMVSGLQEAFSSPPSLVSREDSFTSKHSKALRKKLIEAEVITREWADRWSPQGGVTMNCP